MAGRRRRPAGGNTRPSTVRAIEGDEVEVEACRQAFIAAAKEAGCFIREEGSRGRTESVPEPPRVGPPGDEPFENAVVAAQVLLRRDTVEPGSFEGSEAT